MTRPDRESTDLPPPGRRATTDASTYGNYITETKVNIASLRGPLGTSVLQEAFVRCDEPRRRVENSLHWVLDMVFREDESRMRKGNSPENFVILRRIALNLVRRHSSITFSLKARRRAAGWNDSYL